MMWLREIFGTEKPIIAMCHFKALPGDPLYDVQGGVSKVIDLARQDLIALQDGGVDAVMFSNEESLPYLTKTEPITAITMARMIGALETEIKIPFGVNVLWDPYATIDLAVATEAAFVREIFTGVYASDFGLWNTNVGRVVRHQTALHGGGIRKFFNILPEAAVYLAERGLDDITRSTIFNTLPDALCVSGLTAGIETKLEALEQVKVLASEIPVFANTGVTLENVKEQLSIADGAVIGTYFKQNGNIWNPVDRERVFRLMEKVQQIR